MPDPIDDGPNGDETTLAALPAPIAGHLDANREELVSAAGTLLSHDTADPPGHTVTAWVASQ